MISYQPFPASFTTFTSSPFFREAMGVPLVLAYHVIAYRVFRGRLDDKDVNY